MLCTILWWWDYAVAGQDSGWSRDRMCWGDPAQIFEQMVIMAVKGPVKLASDPEPAGLPLTKWPGVSRPLQSDCLQQSWEYKAVSCRLGVVLETHLLDVVSKKTSDLTDLHCVWPLRNTWVEPGNGKVISVCILHTALHSCSISIKQWFELSPSVSTWTIISRHTPTYYQVYWNLQWILTLAFHCIVSYIWDIIWSFPWG